jgi:hypothetical protein
VTTWPGWKIARLGLRVDVSSLAWIRPSTASSIWTSAPNSLDVIDRAADQLPQAGRSSPRVGLEPAQAQADALALGVDLDDHGLPSAPHAGG